LRLENNSNPFRMLFLDSLTNFFWMNKSEGLDKQRFSRLWNPIVRLTKEFGLITFLSRVNFKLPINNEGFQHYRFLIEQEPIIGNENSFCFIAQRQEITSFKTPSNHHNNYYNRDFNNNNYRENVDEYGDAAQLHAQNNQNQQFQRFKFLLLLDEGYVSFRNE